MSDNRATLKDAAEVHRLVAKGFTADLQDPEKRTPALLAAASKWLKDQGVTASPERSADIKKLLDSLPFRDEDDELEIRP